MSTSVCMCGWCDACKARYKEYLRLEEEQKKKRLEEAFRKKTARGLKKAKRRAEGTKHLTAPRPPGKKDRKRHRKARSKSRRTNRG